MEYTLEEVSQKVCVAIGVLFKNDSFLLENSVNERSISHKLVIYLEKQFPDWDVDCEYNRDKGMSKEWMHISECDSERKVIVYTQT